MNYAILFPFWFLLSLLHPIWLSYSWNHFARDEFRCPKQQTQLTEINNCSWVVGIGPTNVVNENCFSKMIRAIFSILRCFKVKDQRVWSSADTGLREFLFSSSRRLSPIKVGLRDSDDSKYNFSVTGLHPMRGVIGEKCATKIYLT